MPNHRIHLKLAEEVLRVHDVNPDVFKLGSVLPDIADMQNIVRNDFMRKSSYFHFYGNKGIDIPDIQLYYKGLPNVEKTVLGCGVLLHLIADKCFNEMFQEHLIFDVKGNPCRIIDVPRVMSPRQIGEAKHRDFSWFSGYLKHQTVPDITRLDNNVIKVINQDFETEMYTLEHYLPLMQKYVEKIEPTDGYIPIINKSEYLKCIDRVLDLFDKYMQDDYADVI